MFSVLMVYGLLYQDVAEYIFIVVLRLTCHRLTNTLSLSHFQQFSNISGHFSVLSNILNSERREPHLAHNIDIQISQHGELCFCRVVNFNAKKQTGTANIK